MIAIAFGAVLGVAVLSLVWLRIAARHAERRSVRDYERALGALGGVSRRSERRAAVSEPDHLERGHAHVTPAGVELTPAPRAPTLPAKARIDLPARGGGRPVEDAHPDGADAAPAVASEAAPRAAAPTAPSQLPSPAAGRADAPGGLRAPIQLGRNAGTGASATPRATPQPRRTAGMSPGGELSERGESAETGAPAGARAGGDSGSTARLRPSGELRAAPGLRPPGDRRRRSEPDDSPPTQISPAARPIARFPRPPAHRYTQPGRSYGPPVPGGSEPEEAVDGQPVAPAAATAATAPTPPATPRQGEPAPSRPPVESPTEVVEAVGRRPSGSTLSQLVARSRRARTVDPAAAEPPALLDAEASSTAPAGETSTPARPSRSRGGAAALASGTSLRTAIPAVRPTRPRAGDEALSDSGRGNGTRRPGPGGSGSPGKGAEAGNGQAGSAAADDEALQATRVFAPASLQGTPAPPTTKRGDLDAPEDLDAAGAPGDEAWPGEVDVTGDRHGTVLGGVDLSGNEEPQAVPIVFDFDELAEPPLAAIPVRPIRGLRPPGGGKKALRVVTGAATVAVLAAGGALIWDLATKTGPGHAPSASKSSAGSATKATITPRHATAGRTRTSVPPKQVTHPSVPAPSTTAPSATLTPLSSNQSLTVYRAPTGRYTLAFKVSSGDCWVGAEIAGTYTWMETIYPDTPASYATRGTVTVRIGAPSVLSVSVNGKPVTLPANSQPYDIEFATAAPAQSGTAVPAKSGTAAPAKSGTAAPAK